MKSPRPRPQRGCTCRHMPGSMRAHLTHGEIVLSQGERVLPQLPERYLPRPVAPTVHQAQISQTSGLLIFLENNQVGGTPLYYFGGVYFKEKVSFGLFGYQT